jgi:hypothetical protein
LAKSKGKARILYFWRPSQDSRDQHLLTSSEQPRKFTFLDYANDNRS